MTTSSDQNGGDQGLAPLSSTNWRWTEDYGVNPISPYAGTATGGNVKYTANFGQRPFKYTAPTGFKAINSANL